MNIPSWLRQIFVPSAKKAAQQMLDAYKPAVLAVVDRAVEDACNQTELREEEIEARIQERLRSGIARIKGLPVYVRVALEIAAARVDIPASAVGTLQQRIRKEGERIKARIRGARL